MIESENDRVDEWTAIFDERQQVFDDLRIEVDKELANKISAVPLKTHDHRSRVKKRSSFREKIYKRSDTDKAYTDPLSQMHDIVGIRVTCLFLDDLDVVDRVIFGLFEDVQKDDKVKNSFADEFGYRSVHYDCHLPASYAGPHYEEIKTITFEVQVRTILQDAWAVVEHTLGYKGTTSIPDESRQDFRALVGLFHLADKTFQQIRDTALEQDRKAEGEVAAITATATGEGTATVSDDFRIDRSTLKALLRSLYPEREPVTDRLYSELVEQLAMVGVVGVNELRDILTRQESEALDQERTWPPMRGDDPTTYADVGFARTCMTLESPEFRNLPHPGSLQFRLLR